tara:strand:- start:43 stop:273 length:231 start_codon:yes stop_codon:yes gene_type:complete
MVDVWIIAMKLIISEWFFVENVIVVIKGNYRIITKQELGLFINLTMDGDINREIVKDSLNILRTNKLYYGRCSFIK